MFETVLLQLRPFANEFTRHGKQIFLVGGAVRNLLLGRAVKDFDFTTDAHPEMVQTYFRKVLPTGLQHGTVTVLFQGQPYEVTTFRVDGTYTDSRRPDTVEYTPSLEEDLKRRDFTINAMALNLETGELVDPHHGQADLERQVLRAIGEPGQRFDEDALRLLRLFRFASQLGFSVDSLTMDAVGPRRTSLAAVSRERVREELLKTMAGAEPSWAWSRLALLGFLEDAFSPLAPQALTEPQLATLANLRPEVRWSYWLTLCCTLKPEEWEQSLRRLTFSNHEIQSILGPAKAWTILSTAERPVPGAKAIVELWGTRERAALGLEYLRGLEAVGFWVDAQGWCAEIERAAGSSEPIFLAELAIGGRDLLQNGTRPGPDVGRVLKLLQREVWEFPERNTVDSLVSRARELP